MVKDCLLWTHDHVMTWSISSLTEMYLTPLYQSIADTTQMVLFIHTGVDLGENCSRDAECLDENAFCDPYSETCVCKPETYDSNGIDCIGGTCRDRKSIFLS